MIHAAFCSVDGEYIVFITGRAYCDAVFNGKFRTLCIECKSCPKLDPMFPWLCGFFTLIPCDETYPNMKSPWLYMKSSLLIELSVKSEAFILYLGPAPSADLLSATICHSCGELIFA